MQALREISATQYFRSHELLAYKFFIETSNPFRVVNCDDAEFEYIPFLPLHWVAKNSKDPNCSYTGLINDIVTYVKMKRNERSLLNTGSGKGKAGPIDHDKTPIPFIVASTFNLRTEMRVGMPTQIRRGEIYDIVTEFVTTTRIGHYERWPQCPDLLRKWWRYHVEIPYVPTFSFFHNMHVENMNIYNNENTIFSTNQAYQAEFPLKDITVLFVGRLLLTLNERVCSVRNAVASLSLNPNVLVINVTTEETEKQIFPPVFHYYGRSIFCLITKADSYSSASFYIALHAGMPLSFLKWNPLYVISSVSVGCIPIVISDWFVFAFPWVIPYEEFVIRVSESDFLMDPEGVIKGIQKYYTIKRLQIMRKKMVYWLGLLTYEAIPYNSVRYQTLKAMFMNQGYIESHYHTTNGNIWTKINNEFHPQYDSLMEKDLTQMKIVLPFELMLYEMRYALYPYEIYPNIPCINPYDCSKYGKTLDQLKFPFLSIYKNKEKKSKPSQTTTIYDENDLKLVMPLQETRSHLCKHAPRLIGYYKIVYFMQCVRILWPLQPGKLKPHDNPQLSVGKNTMNGLTYEDYDFLMNFHGLGNLSKTGQFIYVTYPKSHNENGVQNFRKLNISNNLI
jgi:hypothetical protein